MSGYGIWAWIGRKWLNFKWFEDVVGGRMEEELLFGVGWKIV